MDDTFRSSAPRLVRKSMAATAIAVGALLTLFAGAAFAHGFGFRGQRGHALAGAVATVGTDSFTVTAHRARTFTVQTTSATSYLETTAAAVADAVAGSWVRVKGTTGPDSSIAAKRIAITPAPARTGGFVKRDVDSGRAFVAGTVVTNNASTGTLTVHAASEDVTVTTTPDTTVTKTAPAGFSALAAGERVVAKGSWTADDIFTARAIHIDATAAHVTKTAAVAAIETTTTTAAPTTTTTATPAPAPVVVTKVVTKTAPGAAHVDADHGDDHAFAVFGTVATVSSPSFTVNTFRGGTVTVVTNSATTFSNDSGAGSMADVTPGTKVVVKGTKNADGTVTATVVRTGAGCDGDHHFTGDPNATIASHSSGDDDHHDGRRDGGWRRSGRR